MTDLIAGESDSIEDHGLSLLVIANVSVHAMGYTTCLRASFAYVEQRLLPWVF